MAEKVIEAFNILRTDLSKKPKPKPQELRKIVEEPGAASLPEIEPELPEESRAGDEEKQPGSGDQDEPESQLELQLQPEVAEEISQQQVELSKGLHSGDDGFNGDEQEASLEADQEPLSEAEPIETMPEQDVDHPEPEVDFSEPEIGFPGPEVSPSEPELAFPDADVTNSEPEVVHSDEVSEEEEATK